MFQNISNNEKKRTFHIHIVSELTFIKPQGHESNIYTVLSKDNTNLMSVDALLNCIKRIYSLVLYMEHVRWSRQKKSYNKKKVENKIKP